MQTCGMLFLLSILVNTLSVTFTYILKPDKCAVEFNNDQMDLDPYRFQGYWYATHFSWSDLPWWHVYDVQLLYSYSPGRPGAWTVAVGVYRDEDQCIRHLFNITSLSTGSNLFRDPGFFHHVIDTDYYNYAVVLFCSNARRYNRCDFADIQTVILSRSPEGPDKQDIWPVVKEKLSICTDPSKLRLIQQKKKCVCTMDMFEVGTGPRCD